MKITHPSMKNETKNENIGAEQQVFVVDDPTLPVVEQSPGPVSAPVVFETSMPPIKKELKGNLENLIFLGKVEKEIELAGVKFEISTLTHAEHNLLMKQIYTFGSEADMIIVRTLTLAQALRKIDGVPVESIDIDQEFDSVYKKKIFIVERMQMSLVDKLYDVYNTLVSDSDDLLEGKEIKNS